MMNLWIITTLMICYGAVGFVLRDLVLFIRKKRSDTQKHSVQFIQRRAELYREFFQEITNSGVHRMEDDNRMGDWTIKERIVWLRRICNNAQYELSPFASTSMIKLLFDLSSICQKYRELILSKEDDEEEKDWKAFKQAFQFRLVDVISIAGSDCQSEDIQCKIGMSSAED